MLLTDRSRTVLLDVPIAKSKSDKMSKPLAADMSVADVVLGPGEASSTGNVTGGRKLARYDFGRPWRWGERKLPQRNHQPIEVGGDDQSHLAARQRQHCAVLVD
jgi:hypothetical protein